MSKKKKAVVRLDDDGAIHEAVISCDEVHFERLNHNLWWVGIYRKKKVIAVDIVAKHNGLMFNIVEDGIGLKGD